MKVSTKYQKEFDKYVAKNWTSKNRTISHVLEENFGNDKHMMLIEEEKIDQEKSHSLSQDNFFLEKVDLSDYWKIFENGRTNKKR